MAAPSLQEIFAKEPGLAAKIDAMTELLPGVPASKENLKTLLEHVMKGGSFVSDTDETSKTSILFLMQQYRGKKQIEVQVLGKAEVVRWAHGVYDQRPCVCNEVFKCTEEGLLEGLLYAKQNAERYREEGPCPDCDRSDETQPPSKKLKAMGLPKCEICMFEATVAE